MKARQSVGGKTTEAPASPKASAWDEVKNPMVPQGLLEQFPGQTLAGGDFVSSSQRPSANLKSDFVSSSQRPSAKEPAPHLFSQMTAEEKAPRSAPLEHALDNLGKNIPPPDREGKPLPKPKQKAKFGL
jgi:hypothetical protein